MATSSTGASQPISDQFKNVGQAAIDNPIATGVIVLGLILLMK